MSKESLPEQRRPPLWLKWGAVALFVAWMFYSLSAYYVVQKPLSLPLLTALIESAEAWWRLSFSAAAIGRSLLDLSAALWLSVIALGVGLRFLKALNLLPPTDLETMLFSLGLGFGTLGLGGLALGLAGLLQPALFVVLAVVLSLLSARQTISFLRSVRLTLPPPLVSVYLLLTIGLALLAALLPPASWDALFYHLKGPKLYLAAGQIRPGIDIPHLNFPSLFEMLFMFAMAIRGDVAAKLLHFEFSFLLAGLVYVIARHRVQVSNGWVSVLFLYATPMLLLLAGWAYNDLALAFYQLAALHTVLLWQSSRQEKWLVLAGILSGFALSLKYTSFVAPIVFAGILVWEHRQRPLQAGRSLLLLAFPALIIALPWYAKNLLFTGNPVYPFVFDGRFWDGFRANAYAAPGTGTGFDPIALLRLPHDLTLGLQDASQDGPPGPLYLLFLPLILFYAFSALRKAAPPAFRYLLLFALAQYLFWMLGVIFSAGLWQSRLLLPAFAAMCPVMAWVWQDLKRLDHPQFSLRRFLGLTLAFSLLLNLIGQVANWLPRAPLAYVIGTDSRSAVLSRELGLHYLVMEDLNDRLPPDAVVSFLWEPRSYYCERDCRPDSILDTYAHWEHLHGSASAMAEAWQQQGITHILLFNSGLDFVLEAGYDWIAPRDLSTLRTLQEEYWMPIAQWDRAYTLYALKPAKD